MRKMVYESKGLKMSRLECLFSLEGRVFFNNVDYVGFSRRRIERKKYE